MNLGASVHKKRLASASDLPLAVAQGDGGEAAVRINGNAVIAAAEHAKRKVRRIHLEHVVAVKIAHTHIDRSGVQLYLNRVVIQIQVGNRGLPAHANRRGPDMHLSSRAVACPETISRSHGPVDGGPAPVRLAAGLERNLARHVVQPGHTHRWIIKRGGGLRNHNEKAEHQAYAPAEICKTDRCLHHTAPSGHAIGAPFSTNRHLNVTLREGVFGNANQAHKLARALGARLPPFIQRLYRQGKTENKSVLSCFGQ